MRPLKGPNNTVNLAMRCSLAVLDLFKVMQDKHNILITLKRSSDVYHIRGCPQLKKSQPKGERLLTIEYLNKHCTNHSC